MSAFLLCAALFLPQFGMTNGGSAEVSANFAVEEGDDKPADTTADKEVPSKPAKRGWWRRSS